jgi:cysteine sulfinate desulfinase/cysteine desulfurase-like protein
VLTAMGLDEADAYSSVRFSFTTMNTVQEVDQAVRVVAATVAELRAQGRRLAANPNMAEVP